MALTRTITYLRLAARFMIRNPGFSSAFVICRDFPKWFKHSQPGSNSVQASLPWLTFGAARPSCMFHAMKKVKSSGYLILDNSEREYYLENITVDHSKWKRTDYKGAVPFSNYFSQTTIFQNTEQ